MITQILITNWVLLLTTVATDTHLLSNRLEHTKYVGTVLGYWALLSIAATLAWIIYFIWSV